MMVGRGERFAVAATLGFARDLAALHLETSRDSDVYPEVALWKYGSAHGQVTLARPRKLTRSATSGSWLFGGARSRPFLIGNHRPKWLFAARVVAERHCEEQS